MSDNDDKWPIKFVGEKGRTTARQMSNRVIDSDSFERRILGPLDGNHTVLETKGGMPRVKVVKLDTGDSVLWPRGLCAYPSNKAESTWLKPQLVDWLVADGYWKSWFRNPPQTKKAVPDLPAWTNIPVRYRMNAIGDVCLCYDSTVFYGLKSGAGPLKDWYTKWKKSDYEGAGTPLLPFTVELEADEEVADKKLLTTSSEGKVNLRYSDGTSVYEFQPTRVVNGETKDCTFLPPAVTNDGRQLVFNAFNDTNWGVPEEGAYNLQPEKEYQSAVVTIPGFSATVTEENLHCFSKFDGSWEVKSGSDENADVADVDGVCVWSVPGTGVTPSIAFHHHINGTDGGVWIPGGFISVGEKAKTEKSNKRHDWHKREYKLPLAYTVAVGNVAVGPTTKEVTVTVSGNLLQTVFAEGKYADGRALMPDGVDPMSVTIAGQTDTREKRTRMDTDNTDAFTVTVSVGDTSLAVFEHNSTSKVQGKYGYKNWRYHPLAWGVNGGANYMVITENYPNSLRDHGPVITGLDDIPCPHDLNMTPFVLYSGAKYTCSNIAGLQSAVDGAEIIADKWNFMAVPPDGVWHDAGEEDTPYKGTVAFNAISRNVFAFDPEFPFIAYVEIAVEARCSFASGEHSWVIPPNDAKLDATHTVTAKLVVKYRGEEYSDDLFTESFIKPGPWYRQEIIDWRTWPWGPFVIPDTVYTVQGPRIWPDVNKYKSVDKFFYNQGNTPELAGITRTEILNRDPESTKVEKLIFAKRFKFSDIDANWIFDDYKISEGKRKKNPTEAEAAAYYYCPALRTRVTEDYYQVQFEANDTGARLRVWTNDLPANDPTAVKGPLDEMTSICYRV